VKRSFRLFRCHHRATPESYTLSLHDALPIYENQQEPVPEQEQGERPDVAPQATGKAVLQPRPEQRRQDCWNTEDPGKRTGCRRTDRKSTRLNSSHVSISYAVFCLKKKKKKNCNSMLNKEKNDDRVDENTWSIRIE